MSAARRDCLGVGLTEVMLTLAIAACAIAAAVALYAKAADAIEAADTSGRMQDVARYAMTVLETDLRMAGFWGLAGPDVTVAANPSLGFPAKCGGKTWVADTARIVAGANDAFLTVAACPAGGGGHRPGTDVLVVRRAQSVRLLPQSATVAAAHRSRVLIVSSRQSAEVFVPHDIADSIPAGFAIADVAGEAPSAETRPFSVNAYYVSVGSSAKPGCPALRRKSLVAGPDIRDEEVVACVEDMQLLFGIDTDGDADVDAYAAPSTEPAGARIVSVRIWLLVRAEDRDRTHVANAPISYAGHIAPEATDGFRRLLFTKTVQIRNARR